MGPVVPPAAASDRAGTVGNMPTIDAIDESAASGETVDLS